LGGWLVGGLVLGSGFGCLQASKQFTNKQANEQTSERTSGAPSEQTNDQAWLLVVVLWLWCWGVLVGGWVARVLVLCGGWCIVVK
jgi:hypothetical protein